MRVGIVATSDVDVFREEVWERLGGEAPFPNLLVGTEAPRRDDRRHTSGPVARCPPRGTRMLTTHLLSPGTEPYSGCRLRQLLKRTEHAEVWRAATDEERPLAVKFVPCDDDRALQHDLPFLLAIRQLSHPHLLRIHWVWCYRNYSLVAMELARGSLLDFLTDSPGEFRKVVAARQVCRYLAEAADALDFLNTRQHRLCGQQVALQHGNIKPSNLLLVGETVKVTDFKLSSEASFEGAPEQLAETLRYAAPEAFGAASVTGQISKRWPRRTAISVAGACRSRARPRRSMQAERAGARGLHGDTLGGTAWNGVGATE